MVAFDGTVSAGLAEAMRHELRLLDPLVRRDRDAVDALLAEDFTELGASGRIWTRDTMMDAIAAFDSSGDPVEVLDIQARELASDLVLVTYVTERAGQSVYRSSVWRHADARWQVVYHQATPLY
jgi:hypothetical protein